MCGCFIELRRKIGRVCCSSVWFVGQNSVCLEIFVVGTGMAALLEEFWIGRETLVGRKSEIFNGALPKIQGVRWFFPFELIERRKDSFFLVSNRTIFVLKYSLRQFCLNNFSPRLLQKNFTLSKSLIFRPLKKLEEWRQSTVILRHKTKRLISISFFIRLIENLKIYFVTVLFQNVDRRGQRRIFHQNVIGLERRHG